MNNTPPRARARCHQAMLANLSRSALLVAVVACKPVATPAPLAQTTGTEATIEAPAAAPGSPECRDVACWLAAAEVAQAAGLVDVASSHRGRVFTQEPTIAYLRAWVDGMRSAGELRRAQSALARARSAALARDDAALVAAIDEQSATLHPAASPEALTGVLAPPLREAHALALAGRAREAALRFLAELGGETRPALVADAASVMWAHAAGDPALQAWARGAWARARVQLHERGASLQMQPVETWMTRSGAWHGDQLVLLRNVGALDVAGLRLGLITISAPEPGAPVRRLFAPEPAEALTLSADGDTLIRGEGPRVVLQQLATGESAPPIAITGEREGARVSRLVSVGVGEALRTLACSGHTTQLWDAHGRQLARFALDGTTPTITRAYTGEGSYHHNLLGDSPTWPVSLALSDDARTVAVGGSDSRVFVFDGAGQRKHVLKFSWDYVEHRHMGGNPDLNQPIALHLSPDGDELLAVHNHGDLIRWSTRSGKPLKHFSPDCDAAEAATVASRNTSPGDPPRAPTADERRSCGRAVSAAFSPDGSMVATGGITTVRVRDTRSGAGLALLAARDLPGDILAFSRSGTLAMVDLYGAVSTWRRGEALVQRLPRRPSGPVDPLLSRDGRVLRFDEGGKQHLWDLREGLRLPLARDPADIVLAIADDGRRVVLRRGPALELREAASGALQLRTPLPEGVSAYARFTRDGHVLLDIQGERRSLLLVDPDGRRSRAIALDPAGTLLLSDDARLIAGLDYRLPGQVWRSDTGALVATLSANIRHLSFARDASALAWLELPDPERMQTRAHLRRIDVDPASEQTIDLDGWPAAVALSPDNRELLILLESGKLWRWRPDTGARRLTEELALYGVHRMDFSDDGRVLLLGGYGRTQLRASDDQLTPLATVHALVDGGWLAISRSGAIAGSPDAVDSLISRVTRGDETLIFDGHLGWDAVHVDGVVARAMAGEDTLPPVTP